MPTAHGSKKLPTVSRRCRCGKVDNVVDTVGAGDGLPSGHQRPAGGQTAVAGRGARQPTVRWRFRVQGDRRGLPSAGSASEIPLSCGRGLLNEAAIRTRQLPPCPTQTGRQQPQQQRQSLPNSSTNAVKRWWYIMPIVFYHVQPGVPGSCQLQFRIRRDQRRPQDHQGSPPCWVPSSSWVISSSDPGAIYAERRSVQSSFSSAPDLYGGCLRRLLAW